MNTKVNKKLEFQRIVNELNKYYKERKIPLSYTFLKEGIVSEKIKINESYSQYHDSKAYSVGYFYKPISLLIYNLDEYE